MVNEKVMVILFIVGSILVMFYKNDFQKPFNYLRGNVKVEPDLSKYVTGADNH